MTEYDISVIIPVYNVKDYLEKCINSVRNQSKKNIEIICIDDCSTDESLEILEKAALEDRRIRIIRNNENKGGLYARKCGVMAAQGNYIMFLDGDDFFSQQACETAYSEIVKYCTDILQFGTNVINVGNAPSFEVDSIIKFVVPCERKLINSNILLACFIEEMYNYNLWNKIYKASLCKKAFSILDDSYYCMAEDMLAYFVLAYFADTYMGIPDKLYNYNFAIGISKPGILDLDGLDKRCCGADSIVAVKSFLEEQGTYYKYEDVYKRIERRILSDNFDAWYYRLPFAERDKGYLIFEKHWGKDKVILGLLYDIENKQFDINQKGRDIENKNNEIKNLSQEVEEQNCELEKLNNIHVKFLDEITKKNKLIEENEADIISLKVQIDELYSEIDCIRMEKESLQSKYEHILCSISYKIGRIITMAPRIIVKMWQKIK